LRGFLDGSDCLANLSGGLAVAALRPVRIYIAMKLVEPLFRGVGEPPGICPIVSIRLNRWRRQPLHNRFV
jgi:hypothetical protein